MKFLLLKSLECWALPNNCMCKTYAYEYYNSFKEERTVVEDLPRTERPSTSTDYVHVNKVKQVVMQYRRISVREIGRDIFQN